MSTTVLQRTPGIAAAWAVSRGAGATVAVVDEGVSARHHAEFNARVSAAGAIFGAEEATFRCGEPFVVVVPAIRSGA